MFKSNSLEGLEFRESIAFADANLLTEIGGRQLAVFIMVMMGSSVSNFILIFIVEKLHKSCGENPSSAILIPELTCTIKTSPAKASFG